MPRMLTQVPPGVQEGVVALSSRSSAYKGASTEMIGTSPTWRHLNQLIERIAPTDRPVLINGPTGAGKEVLAQRVHSVSPRANAPFIDVNCGAIPENLVESELFGHVRGAFTGASNTRSGFFQEVGKGTLFLDEIGELPLSLQPKLLRVFETRCFRQVGASNSLPFEGRIIAATHRDLVSMVKMGHFREDLYYRLAVFVLDLPGLNERREDIPALVEYFASIQPRKLTFTSDAMQRLYQQPWPGNVRQLRNVIEKLSVLSESTCVDVLTLDSFLMPVERPDNSHHALADTLLLLEGSNKLAFAESLLIDRALQRSQGNKTVAARLLGVSRKTVERRLKVREANIHAADTLLMQVRGLVEVSQFSAAIPALRHYLERFDGDERTEVSRRLEALRLLGICLRGVHGWSSDKVRVCYEDALKISQGKEGELEWSAIRFGIWVSQLMTLDLSKARATALDMLLRAQRIDDRNALDEAHVAMSSTLFLLGDYEEALAYLGRGGLLSINRDDVRVGIQGFDLAEMALTAEGLSAFQIGAYDQARAAMERLITRSSRQPSHAFSCAIALQGAAWLACSFEEVELLGEISTALENLSVAHGFSFYEDRAKVFRGYHLAWKGCYEEAEKCMQDAYQHYTQLHGNNLLGSFHAWHFADMLLNMGEEQRCIDVITQALDNVLQHQDRTYLGEMLVQIARAKWALGNREEAEQRLHSALLTARAIGSVPARIAAAYQLAMLKREDRPAQAIEILSHALQGVSQAHSPPSHARAWQLLDHLRS